MKGEKGVIIISGGMDSTTLMHYLAKIKKMELYPVSFYYGQKHDIELKMAEEQVKILQKEGYPVHDLKVVDMSFMHDLLRGSSALIDENIEVPILEEVLGEPQPITYVPFRNMVFLSIALSYAEAVGVRYVFYGAQKHDEYSGYWDTTMYFIERMNKVAELNRIHRIRIIAPFVNLSKAEEVVIGYNLGVRFDKTWTSYKPPGLNGCADGDTPTDRDRIMAFARAGLRDPITYCKEIDWDELIMKYKRFDVIEDLVRILEKVEKTIQKQLTGIYY